jgi:hypothetical protein
MVEPSPCGGSLNAMTELLSLEKCKELLGYGKNDLISPTPEGVESFREWVSKEVAKHGELEVRAGAHRMAEQWEMLGE